VFKGIINAIDGLTNQLAEFNKLERERRAADQRNFEVLKETIESQQRQIDLLNFQLKEIKAGINNPQVLEVFSNQKIQDQQDQKEHQKSKYEWVHVPTNRRGDIMWSSSDMTREQVENQVLYELEAIHGVDISLGRNLDTSLYTQIKSHNKGISWGEIVERARQNAIKVETVSVIQE